MKRLKFREHRFFNKLPHLRTFDRYTTENMVTLLMWDKNL